MPDYLILIATLGGMEIYGINGFVIGPLLATFFLSWLGMPGTFIFGLLATVMASILLLLITNAPMLRFNCPSCGKNVFFRGPFVIPWPNRICTKCGRHLDEAPAQER